MVYLSSSKSQPALKALRPFLSSSNEEAKKRVLNLYKLWYRQVPYVVNDFDIPLTVEQCRAKIRSEFEANKHLTDMRAIDVLVVKGQMDLVETAEIWKQRSHVMTMFEGKVSKKSDGFLNDFYKKN